MEAAGRIRRVRFDAFEVDMRSGEVRKHGIRLKLHGQPFQVLSLLLEHPGDLVTREELRQKLWPGETFVDFDTGLRTQAPGSYRQAARLRSIQETCPAHPGLVQGPRFHLRKDATVSAILAISIPTSRS